jgi:hypothetical protein
MQTLLALLYCPLWFLPSLVVFSRMRNSGIRKGRAILAGTFCGAAFKVSLDFAVHYFHLNGSLLLIFMDSGNGWLESIYAILLAAITTGLCFGLLLWLVPGILGERAAKHTAS